MGTCEWCSCTSCVKNRHIAELESTERELRDAVWLLARELEFRRRTREPAPVAWRYELEANPIASAAVREAAK